MHIGSRLMLAAAPTVSLALHAVAQGDTERISVSTGGAAANGHSSNAHASRDGRYVVFASLASNLVTPDLGGFQDVFLRDRVAGTTELVALGPGGAQANGHSQSGPISADGRCVSFGSWADNLVPSDTNQVNDVFVRDRAAGTTVRVSVGSAGAQANGSSGFPALTPDGRFVAFESAATNLVAASDLNFDTDVFVRDRVTGTTALISAAPSGGTGIVGGARRPALSDDGRFVVFDAWDPGLVAGDVNGMSDVFLRDVLLGTTSIASMTTGGAQGNGGSYSPSVSGDGRFVAFQSDASNFVAGDTNGLTDIFVRDRMLATTTRINLGPAGVEAQPGPFGQGSYLPWMSSDGALVAFTSASDNLVPGDAHPGTDTLVRDRNHATTACASLDSAGNYGHFGAGYARISGDGSLVVFEAPASTFTPGAPVTASDVFARRTGASLPRVYCTAKTNSLGCVPALSFTGFASASQAFPFVVFASEVRNQKSGLFFYGAASQAAPFQGGTLCVLPPTVRTPLQSSGGSPAGSADCSGIYGIDVNLLAQGGAALLTAGTRVFGQFWMRDPGSSFNSGFSDAIDFNVLP